MHVRHTALCLVTVSVLAAPSLASAQAVGIGPRMSLVRPDADAGLPEGTPSDRYTGGALRLRVSPRTAFELAADWKSTTSEDATVRLRNYPVQGSLLLYPVSASLAPYIVGGVGWYSQTLEGLVDGEAATAMTVRRFGYHGGFGADIKMGKRATLFADYRYRFIRFGDDALPEGEEGAGALGLPGVGSLIDVFRMSHEGAMWTGGVVIHF
jgi:hypothetical protein